MADYLDDNILDSGLNYLDTNGTRLDICSAQPATYAEATSTYTLGNKTSIAISAPADHTSGRKVTISAISDGTVTGSDTATHFAITNGSDTLLVAADLSAPQGVTSGNTFTLTEFIVYIPDPA